MTTTEGRTAKNFCIFCGNTVVRHSREHVIPRWLIDLTGDRYRLVTFGPFWNRKTHKLENRKYPFDQFAFSACESCNQKFSTLEAHAKDAVIRMTNERPLSSTDLSNFLNWLDKVRIGFWLAFFILQENTWNIQPSFHINWRTGATDRMVLIYKSDHNMRRVSVIGHNVPAFQYQPSCFVLIINNFVFLNISTDFLLSERLGLPYPTRVSYAQSRGAEITMTTGHEKISYPIVRLKYDKHCSGIFQPMFARSDIRSQFPMYDTDYVRSLSADHDKGIGKIFFTDGSIISEYPQVESREWIPKWTWKDHFLIGAAEKQCLELQIRLSEYGPYNYKIRYNHLAKGKRRLIASQIGTAKKINWMLLKKLEEYSEVKRRDT